MGGVDMKRNREGFSLIELIISIAILTIFVGLAALSVGLLRSADTKGLASRINDSLTDLKSVTQAHSGPYYLHIYKTDDGYFSTYDSSESFTTPATNDSSERLGSSSLGVKTDAGELTESDPVTISILKKDGSYELAPKYFEIKNGDKIDYKVILAKDTGLHYMEQQ